MYRTCFSSLLLLVLLLLYMRPSKTFNPRAFVHTIYTHASIHAHTHTRTYMNVPTEAVMRAGRKTKLCMSSENTKDDKGQGAISVNDGEYMIRVYNTISEIGRDRWNSFVTEYDSPFIEYDWLHSLEVAECASMRLGWQPLHIGVYNREDKLVALSPMYAKYNSYGEFIFDQSWAQFAQQSLGIQYYPKLLIAIPFTPATGSRMIFAPHLHENDDSDNGKSKEESASIRQKKDAIMKSVAAATRSLTRSNKLSSCHVNFMQSEEVPSYKDQGFLLRQTIQYRWENRHKERNEMHETFDDYLAEFKSKRRIQIKRERSKVIEQGVKVKVIRGDEPEATEELYETMFQLYQTTVEKMWGTQYLSSRFFNILSQLPHSFRKNLVFVVAVKENESKIIKGKINENIIAGTINFCKGDKFYGRYWGCFEFVNNLHFEVCYYRAIEYCIENKIQYMEPGAGGGSFKYLRGFDPYIVNSVHYLDDGRFNTAVSQFLDQEKLQNTELATYLIERKDKIKDDKQLGYT